MRRVGDATRLQRTCPGDLIPEENTAKNSKIGKMRSPWQRGPYGKDRGGTLEAGALKKNEGLTDKLMFKDPSSPCKTQRRKRGTDGKNCSDKDRGEGKRVRPTYLEKGKTY